MEIELKYAIADKETSERIWNDPKLASMEEEDSREKLLMKAVYFDTEDFDLSRKDIAFRIRAEGERTVASLKWNGTNDGALHTRQEINVPVSDDSCLILPDPSIFKESDVGMEVLEFIGDKQLLGIIEMTIMRKRLRVDTGKSIIEVSVDNGEIKTDKGIAPVCEVELELFTGNCDELLALGECLAKTYGLQPEKRSKYARGLALLEQK